MQRHLQLTRGAAAISRSFAARCHATSKNGQGRRVAVGDIVTIRFSCTGDANELAALEEDWIEETPLTFEVGAGDVVGNKLFQGFDEAVRGLHLGESIVLETQAGEWNADLLFKIPVTHPEIQRLQGRYQFQGGLQKGKIVELLNKQLALVVDIEESCVTLDANNMMAGKKLAFEIRVEDITDAAH